MITGNPTILFPGDINHLVKDGPMFVSRFVFHNYTDGEHRCRLIDRDGNDIFNVRARLDFAPVQIEDNSPGAFWAPFLLELDSGQLSIYIR